MIRLILILVIAALACRLLFNRWPWELFAPSSHGKELDRARALLGVGRNASREEIIEAHRNLVVMVHPDRGGTKEQVHEANDARDLLLGALAARRPE